MLEQLAPAAQGKRSDARSAGGATEERNSLEISIQRLRYSSIGTGVRREPRRFGRT
jgi:hypothetical protein